MPTARIRPICFSSDQGKPARRDIGTPHTVFSAFWAAAATPRAPRKVRMSPMISAGADPCSVCCSRWPSAVVPITGKWLNAELSTCSRSAGSWASTMFSTVTNTSSSGNSEAKP